LSGATDAAHQEKFQAGAPKSEFKNARTFGDDVVKRRIFRSSPGWPVFHPDYVSRRSLAFLSDFLAELEIRTVR